MEIENWKAFFKHKMNVKFLFLVAVVCVAFASFGSVAASRTRRYKQVYSFREKCSKHRSYDNCRTPSRSSLSKLICKIVGSVMKDLSSNPQSSQSYSLPQDSSYLSLRDSCGPEVMPSPNMQYAQEADVCRDSRPSLNHFQQQYFVPSLLEEPCEPNVMPSPIVQYVQRKDICLDSYPSSNGFQQHHSASLTLKEPCEFNVMPPTIIQEQHVRDDCPPFPIRSFQYTNQDC